jgi:hypothetical protein
MKVNQKTRCEAFIVVQQGLNKTKHVECTASNPARADTPETGHVFDKNCIAAGEEGLDGGLILQLRTFPAGQLPWLQNSRFGMAAKLPVELT